MTKQIKVLHTEWGDGWGGQEIRTIKEMQAVTERGVKVYLACTAHAQIGKRAKALGFEVFYFPFKGNWDYKTLFGIKKLIKDLNIDIVNTHSSKDTLVGGLAAKLSGRKFIRTRHLSIPVKKSSLMNKLADHVITTGEAVRQNMISYSGLKASKVTSVATGVDEVQFDPLAYDPIKMRQKFAIKESEIAVGIIAVLRNGKRHDLFLQMGKLLKEKSFNVRLIIAGSGPGAEKIEALIKELGMSDYVTLTGHIDQPQELLSALDYFVLSSDAEGVPQSVIQALAMQKAVLATDVGSTADLYQGDNFLLVPPGNPAYWADQLESLIKDPDKKNKLESNARGSVLEDFSIKAMTDKVLSIYHQVLGLDDD
ncbi:glycosyltransferase family 4 protein [Thiotrichales bacterium 19S3-7]|nr:glycosyltransferase family 4 protein [Thiotrichales bacterium 19S3-7]MCF6800975.1 glycosyltransferase family 4 protein [Thiotrichales bacterium 19S3-11]